MKESDIIEVYNEGPSAVVSLVQCLFTKIDELTETVKMQSEQINQLMEENAELKAENKRLNERVEKLEIQIKKNSTTSHQPPSTDGFNKPKTKSLREPSGHSTGGQKGHKGRTLKFSDAPTEIIELTPCDCVNCGASLVEVVPSKVIRRQVIEMPQVEMVIIEYRADMKVCPNCRHKNKGAFPTHVKRNVQYGPILTACVAYLHQQQLVPLKRIQDLFNDFYSYQISEGTIVSMIRRASEALIETEKQIKEQLVTSSLAHLDETGCYVGKKRHWLHVTSNKDFTYYHVHEKRGGKAIEDIDILPRFTGTAIHDNWAVYFKYENCTHGLCNVHHLRELNAIVELHKQDWAQEMKHLLLEAKEYSENNSYPLMPDDLEKFEERYEAILAKGYVENPRVEGGKNTEPIRLLNRLSRRQEEVLEFLYQEEVPFENNQAERDCRMTKVKQKISGTFRTEQGAEDFARIRGFFSTCQKQGVNVLEGLRELILGNPCLIFGT